jgi:hypothetical protein
MSTDRTPQGERERSRESAAALAALERRAAEQGVRPLSFDELLGDPGEGDPGKEDVDDFLALRREWREEERARGRQ